ncbi:MAG: AAA family ATPase [Bacilli bacterium]|nr:AAA family ATPase [Bacilli bacterium]
MLKLPIGIENYVNALKCYYIDKTLLIRDLVEYDLNATVLVTRPRRFGKSLALSMVETFFDMEKDSHPYFDGKRIAQEWDQYETYINSAPVIHLSMKGITAATIDDFYGQIALEISKLFIERYDLLSRSITPFEMENVEVLSKGAAPRSTLMNSLELLTAYMHKATGKKVVLLIDEYDTPIQSAFDNGYYKEAILFCKSFYTAALKGNDNLLLALVTGVIQIAKESLFSGLNNLRVYSVLENRLSSYFGFSGEEVQGLLDYYQLNVSLEKVASYYGGYRFGEERLFNPWSVLNFVDGAGKFRFYWKNTGSNSLVYTLAEGNERSVNELIMDTCNETPSPVTLDTSLSYSDLKSGKSSLASFLVGAGYLTVKEELDDGAYILTTPNIEVANIFKSEIANRYFNGDVSALPDALRTALSTANEAMVASIFEEYVLRCFSYFDFSDWKNYQILTLGIVAILFDKSIVKSEVNGKEGRCDISISPKNEGEMGIIIEIKHSLTVLSQARLKQRSAAALKQIKKQHYYDELKQRKAHPIILYGFAFDSSHIEVSSEIVPDETA